jgi:hypothetical protein
MKRIVTISAALVLGTLMFNAAANAGEKEMSKHDWKSYKHDEHRKDFWKDFCYDFDCYGYDYCDYYWFCYDSCNYDHCGYDYCNHDGCSHDTCSNGLPRIGNNPPGVPPHEGPSSPTPIWEKDGGKGIFTVYGSQNGSTLKQFPAPRLPVQNTNSTSAVAKFGIGPGKAILAQASSSPNKPGPGRPGSGNGKGK